MYLRTVVTRQSFLLPLSGSIIPNRYLKITILPSQKKKKNQLALRPGGLNLAQLFANRLLRAKKK